MKRTLQAVLFLMQFLLCIPTHAEDNADIPHNGDSMRVVFMQGDDFVAVDTVGLRAEPDGSRSVIVLMGHPSQGYANAGRLAFLCKSQRYHIASLYRVEKGGAATPINGSMPYELVQPGSLAALVFTFVCGQEIAGTDS